jgi:hypothetical protein
MLLCRTSAAAIPIKPIHDDVHGNTRSIRRISSVADRDHRPMNDTELLARALNRRDKPVKAQIAPRANSRECITIAILIFTAGLATVLLY